MILRSSSGKGRYAANEEDVYVSDSASWAAGGRRGLLYFHGDNETATYSRDFSNIGELHLVNDLADQFQVLSIDAGGTSAWGNATAMARGLDGRTNIQGTWKAKSGTVVCVGVSMGAVTALNFAKANPTLVSAVVCVIPAIDLNDIVTNNRGGLAAQINAAYGGTYSEVTNGPTSNPANYASTFATPTLLYYASDDAVLLPSTVTTFASSAKSASAYSLGALGHTQAAIDAVPRGQVISFLSQFA